MSCPHCMGIDGEPCYPVYGVGPHAGFQLSNGSLVSIHRPLPPEQWPDNYREDPDNPGIGTWWCQFCGEGKPDETTTPTKEQA